MGVQVKAGIEVLLARHREWLAGRRVALLSHAAVLDGQGRSTAALLHACRDCRLSVLMGPEHGWFGTAGAGEACRDARHPAWRIPVWSLYGERRAPSAEALARQCDVVVLDLQDLGYRHYTYGSTLMLVLEACQTAGLPLIVCDRPIPLPDTVDGPLLEPGFRSFVGMLPAPMVYGMTPGETARWLAATQFPAVDLRVAPLEGWRREPMVALASPPWIAPSPGIVSVQSAMSYPSLVFSEAFGRFDHGAGTAFSFQILAAPGREGAALAEACGALRLPGATVSTHWRAAPAAARGRQPWCGVRLQVTEPARFRPIAASVAVVQAAQSVCGLQTVWADRRTRPAFFDKLYGTDAVRRALRDGASLDSITASWRDGLRQFRRSRRRYLLYTS